MRNTDKLVEFKTAKLAKEKGFYWIQSDDIWYYENGELDFSNHGYSVTIRSNEIAAPTQSLLQKFIREKRGVHIQIHRNGSGYYWSMCKEDGGTDLGWSDYKGPNAGGAWDKFEDALEDALFVQLSYDLPENTKVIKHWGNYVEFALKN